jgi:hypothetical protein
MLYQVHLVWAGFKLTTLVRSHFRNRYLCFYWEKWFYIGYVALARWLVPCLPFPGLPHDLEFFMFAVMKTFITDISASIGRNDFIFDMWLWHGDLYRVSPFQAYCTSTSCLPRDKGETRYKSPCQSHISNIKSFLPVEAEISVTKVWTDGLTDGRTDKVIAI